MENKGSFLNLLVYRKALEIFKVSRAIACSISESKNVFELQFSPDVKDKVVGDLVSHSLRLAPELARIENSLNWDGRIKGVKKIKRSSRFILEKCKKLSFLSVPEQEFLDLLQKEIVQFEGLFAEYLYNLQLRKESDIK